MWCLWVVAGLCLASPAPPAQPPHILITAAETLYRRKMPEACDLVLKLGLEAKDLTDADRVELQLLTAMRRVDDGDEDAAKKAVDLALKLDRSAQIPPFAPTDRARLLLEDRRALLPPPPRNASRNTPLPPTVNREPAVGPLFRAMDGLYQEMQLDAADVVLDLGSQLQLTQEDRAQVLLRKGILRMEVSEEGQARTFFQRGLDADRRAKLPEYAPPKTLRVFQSVRAALPPEPVAPASASAKPRGSPTATQDMNPVSAWLTIGGGAGLVIGTGVLIESSQTPTNQGGQVVGSLLALAGLATLGGAILVQAQPELLQVRVNVAPTYRGGMVLATGRF
jgi:hypothetical protein